MKGSSSFRRYLTFPPLSLAKAEKAVCKSGHPLCEEVKAKVKDMCVGSLQGPRLLLAAPSHRHTFLLLLSLGTALPVGRTSNLVPSPGQLPKGEGDRKGCLPGKQWEQIGMLALQMEIGPWRMLSLPVLLSPW